MSRMVLLLMVLAAVIGGMAAIQPVINGRLGREVGDFGLAAMISVATSTTCMLIYMLITRPEIPSLAQVKSGPWWMWTGGIIGALYVAVSLGVVAKLGATTLASVVLFGQLSTALVADHFGWFGIAQHEISIPRLIGVAMLIGGVALIRWF
ncbi:MAG: DMT family transporter [Thermomicrobiales bacterium]|nr:DMT family transporter [Thermomicrobiales bacterium]